MPGSFLVVGVAVVAGKLVVEVVCVLLVELGCATFCALLNPLDKLLLLGELVC